MKGFPKYTVSLVAIALVLLSNIEGMLAQSSTEESISPAKLTKQANKMMKKGNIYAAADVYKQAWDKEPGNMQVAYKLASAHQYARDYKKAAKWYRKVVGKSADKYPMSRYRYGLMLKMTGEYEQAKQAFENFKSAYQGEDAYSMKRRTQTHIDGCNYALKQKGEQADIEINHLGKHVNSAYTEISPMMWSDSTLLFASLRSDTVIKGKKMDVLSKHLISFYRADKESDTFASAQPFDEFSSSDKHVANGAFSTDRKRFYFTKCKRNDDNNITCAIYVSHKEDGQWQSPQKLEDAINKEGYTSTHPTVAPYRRGQEILYFVSNRPDGEGGKDIWYAVIGDEGKSYRRPRNAGSSINTKGDEVTPFYHEPSNTFYFSSNGQMNMGGYDVYKAEGSKDRWSDVANMGTALNSSTDDMYFRLTGKSGTGFLVSNRPGIYSIRSETCCDDIFTLRHYDKMHFAVKGKVYEEGEDETALKHAMVTIEPVSHQGDSMRSDSAHSDSPYLFPISLSKEYKITASHKGYLAASQTIQLTRDDVTSSDTLVQNIYLTRKVTDQAYELENIYYDYDKWDLREQSKKTLDTLYQILVDNPDIVIELSSHTDSRGSEDYNRKLSQRRAESCVDYLIDKGIAEERLVAKGYGESEPLVEGCVDKPECPEEGKEDCPCYQKNRRTEFTIIGETGQEVNYEDQKAHEN